MPELIPTIALFNGSEDTVEMLTVSLTERGYRAVSGMTDNVKSGTLDFIGFMSTHKPDAIIWDIAPPYDRNWNFFKMVRELRPLEQYPIVLTTTHKKHLDDLAGQETNAIEIIGKPYDMQMIVDAVVKGLGSRATGAPRMLKHNLDGS